MQFRERILPWIDEVSPLRACRVFDDAEIGFELGTVVVFIILYVASSVCVYDDIVPEALRSGLLSRNHTNKTFFFFGVLFCCL
jgi:hypothetical protein